MLKEYLLSQGSGTGRWSHGMPGVQICRFSLPEPVQEPLRPIPVCGAPLQFEVLFCLTGRLAVRPLQGTSYTVEAPAIFLLSDSSALCSCQYSGNLGGILIAADAKAAKKSLVTVCSTLGMRLDTRIVKEKMTARNGCMALCGTPWTQSFFETVRYLSEQEQERYSVFKSVELLYLLCTEVSESDESFSGSGCPISQSLLEVKTYIHTHLSDKLTIALLCKQFSLSPTFLKEGFRRAYGVPIHTYLIQQRLRRAQELICTTRMSIQQIVQSVGYEGMSQFNAAFKWEYGMTPGQYRKMSETATLRPF